MTRYIVTYYDGTHIIKDYPTDDQVKALVKKAKLAEIYGHENVWITDNLTEILVG